MKNYQGRWETVKVEIENGIAWVTLIWVEVFGSGAQRKMRPVTSYLSDVSA